MFCFNRLSILFVSAILVFSTTKCVYAQDEELATEIVDVEKKADELIEDGKLFMMHLFQIDTARNTIGAIFLDVRAIFQDPTAMAMCTGITRQIRDTLKDRDHGALSVKYINDAMEDLLTNEAISETFEALLITFENVTLDPETPVLVDQMFELIITISQMTRGVDLVTAVDEGITSVVDVSDPRDDLYKAFKNLKHLLTTGIRGQVKNFVLG